MENNSVPALSAHYIINGGAFVDLLKGEGDTARRCTSLEGVLVTVDKPISGSDYILYFRNSYDPVSSGLFALTLTEREAPEVLFDLRRVITRARAFRGKEDTIICLEMVEGFITPTVKYRRAAAYSYVNPLYLYRSDLDNIRYSLNSGVNWLIKERYSAGLDTIRKELLEARKMLEGEAKKRSNGIRYLI